MYRLILKAIRAGVGLGLGPRLLSSLPLHSCMYRLQQANLHDYIGLPKLTPKVHLIYICKAELFQLTVHLSVYLTQSNLAQEIQF